MTTLSFTVDEDGKVTGDSIIHDDYTRVVLKKVDDEGTPMAGVEFQLAKKDDGTVLFTASTDENGLVKFEKIPYGTYVISETKPLPGYIKNSTDIVIVIDRNYMNKDVPNFEIPNYPNEIVILKTDNRNEPLEGATFGLFDESDKQIMTAVSNDKGEVKFRRIPNGTYTIRETIAPDGFLINKIVKTVTIDDTYRNSAEPLATYVNQPKKIKYIKVDTSGKALPGVEFSLIDASNNEIVETVTSNENGEFIFTKFDYGDWIIRETEASEGFNKMDDITLHVDENWTEPEHFTCVNIPNHYEFVKTDNKGNPLPGVKFRLEDEEGNDLGEYISDENGIVRVTDLKPGTYIIREIETAKGFQRTDEVIKVEISEKYIVPEEMYHLINYPNVQTGVEFQMTPLMWVGAACVLAAAGLAVVYGLKKKTTKKAEKAEESKTEEANEEAQEDSGKESESQE